MQSFYLHYKKNEFCQRFYIKSTVLNLEFLLFCNLFHFLFSFIMLAFIIRKESKLQLRLLNNETITKTFPFLFLVWSLPTYIKFDEQKTFENVLFCTIMSIFRTVFLKIIYPSLILHDEDPNAVWLMIFSAYPAWFLVLT